MPFVITDGCILCDACVQACPNHGIRKGEVIYEIDQDACSECVGFFDRPQCAKVCPMDVCVPNPRIVLTEEELFERARALHANSDTQPVLTPQTSHFQRSAGRRRKPAAPVASSPDSGTPAAPETARQSPSWFGGLVRQWLGSEQES